MRLFVAVWPSPEVTARLRAIDRAARPGWRWTTEDQWHVTLRFLGEVGADEVERGKAALEVLGSVGRGGLVTAVAGPSFERLGPSILCLPVAGLDDVAAQVAALTAGLGMPRADRRFRGHLTVARVGRDVDPRPRPPVTFSASWEVAEVTLVASTLRPQGARYQIIGHYPLGPGATSPGGVRPT